MKYILVYEYYLGRVKRTGTTTIEARNLDELQQKFEIHADNLERPKIVRLNTVWARHGV